MAFTVFSCAFFTGFVNKICVSTSLLCTSDHYTTETEINVDWLNVSGFLCPYYRPIVLRDKELRRRVCRQAHIAFTINKRLRFLDDMV